MLRSCHYNGENINWVNFKSQIFQKKQIQWKWANQTSEWCHYLTYMKIETWKIYLPFITLPDDIQGFCTEYYTNMPEDWSQKGNKECARVYQADQSLSSLRWLKTWKLFWNSKDFYKTTHFWFLITNRNIQASWKIKFLRKRKVSSSSLKFRLPCMNFSQLSHFKVDSKFCRTPSENGGSRWYYCCDNFELTDILII